MDEKEAETRPVMGTIFLVYSKRKAFLEKAVVELAYKFDENSYHECLKS